MPSEFGEILYYEKIEDGVGNECRSSEKEEKDEIGNTKKSEDIDEIGGGGIGNKRKLESEADSEEELEEESEEEKRKKVAERLNKLWDSDYSEACINRIRTTRRQVHEMEDFKEYMKEILESRKYSVPKLPESLTGLYELFVFKLEDEGQERDELNDLSKIAVVKYNSDNGTNYKFDRGVRGNWEFGGSGVMYYITFKVKESESVLELQATLRTKGDGYVVNECQVSQV